MPASAFTWPAFARLIWGRICPRHLALLCDLHKTDGGPFSLCTLGAAPSRSFRRHRKGCAWAGFEIRKKTRKRKIQKQNWESNPFGKADLARRPTWQTKIMMPTTWHIGETAKARRERRSDPYDGNNYYPSYDSGEGKGGHDKGKSKTFAAIVEKPEERPATQQIHMPHQDWDQSWNWSETGWRSFHEISSEGHAMTFRDTFQQNENEIQIFSTKFLRHSLLATKLMAPVINPQHAILDNGCARSMRSAQRFIWAVKPVEDLISHECIPAKTKLTFANGETAKVNCASHIKYPSQYHIDTLNRALCRYSSVSHAARA